MKKTFRMENLDCANCAAKMERKISGIEGVNSVSVNFFAQKMIIDANEDDFENIVSKAQEIVSSVDSECEILR